MRMGERDTQGRVSSLFWCEFLYKCVCVHACEYVCACLCAYMLLRTRGGQGTTSRSQFLSWYVGFGDLTEVIRLGRRRLYLISHLAYCLFEPRLASLRAVCFSWVHDLQAQTSMPALFLLYRQTNNKSWLMLKRSRQECRSVGTWWMMLRCHLEVFCWVFCFVLLVGCFALCWNSKDLLRDHFCVTEIKYCTCENW